MVLKLPGSQKWMLRPFENVFFQFFANFWVTKVKSFAGKVRKSVQDCLNQNLAIGRFLENGFEATLSSKTNVLSVWKVHFSVFSKFLSDEVETIFWESEAKHSKLFKSKFGHRKLLRKWFWSYLELKNECCERLKRAFFSFLQVFEWRSWNHFLGKWGKVFQTFYIKIWSKEASYEMILKLSGSQKWMFWALEKVFFQFFANFWVMKLKPFSGKVRQSVQDYLN